MTVGLLGIRIHYLLGSMIKHLLPGIIELPFMRVGHKPLLGKRHCFLGRGMDF